MQTFSRNGDVWLVETLWKAAADKEVVNLSIPHYDDLRVYAARFRGYCPNEESFLFEMRRLITADLSYPIIVDRNHRILDGIHRMVKAWAQNLSKVKAVVLDPLPAPDAHGGEWRCPCPESLK